LNVVAGKAYVVDGDSIRVAGQEIRIAGLDAPEWDQVARHKDGHWFRQGRLAKSALIRRIGGKYVRVEVERLDKFGRTVGVVRHEGKDVGKWIVEEGHAVAAFDNRYKHVERRARRAKRGMWSNATNIHPGSWRNRKSREKKHRA